jgi:hypothetical protein
MATEKKITSRIQQKHDVAANWAKATNFIPKKGEIIIYDAEYNASGEETQAVRFKIGDGSKTVNNLPFAVIDYSSDIETLEQKVANNSTAIGALQENTVPKTRKINNKALSSDITLGAADVGVNETTFPGLKKTGTVTGVKMNGTTKNPSSGVVDLGTVLTAHQSLDGKQDKLNDAQLTAVNSGITSGKVSTYDGYAALINGKQDKITSSNKLSSSLVDGLGAAAAKAVDTAISANSTSTNLPTSKAVEDRINAHSGIDKVGTVTGVKMNGTTKTPSSGVVDLGTVLTDASKFATSAQGTKADNAVPNTRKVNNKALSSDITLGAADVGVTETAFPGLKKTGTVTGVKMNGTTKNPSSGVVDLGTVITAHQSLDGKQDKITSSNKLAASLVSGLATVATSGSYNDLSNKPTIPDISGKLDKTTYEWNKEFRAGSNGAISLGRYNVYDTQLTFDISSTTTISMNGKLVIATQNGRICQAKVFGDATGVLVSKIVIYQSAIVNNRSWVEVFCNFDGWSKNKVHIYGVALESATVTNQMSSVTFTNGIPSPITSGDSGWSGTIDNDLSNWTGSAGTISIHHGSMTFSAKSGDTYGTAGFDINNAGDNSCGGWGVDKNTAHLRLGIDGACDIELGENAGTAGQVLTSQGADRTPTWTTPPQFTLSGTTLTITV